MGKSAITSMVRPVNQRGILQLPTLHWLHSLQHTQEYTVKREEELLRVQNLLNEAQKEVTAAKKEIARLGKVISSLKGKGASF